MNKKRWMAQKRSRFFLAAWTGMCMLGLSAGSVSLADGVEPRPLQELVDAASAGSTLMIPEGQYIGPVTIKKPLRMVGQGSVTVANPADGPVITVEADGSEITGLELTDSREDPDSVAVQISGSGNTLSKLKISTMGYGVRLSKADRNILKELDIQGMTKQEEALSQEEEPSERGNGIDLFESNDNVISSNRISNMFDGVYIEKGTGNRVEANSVSHSRYGYHLMFSTDTEITDNTGTRNVTGAMIMADVGARVTGNNFAKQSANATAQGILLFDVKNAVVENNRVEGNRLGLYAQDIKGNIIRNNQFLRNFLGIQMTDAEENRLEGNDFIANVIQAQAIADKNNRIAFNYWDDNDGLDLQGDGISDLSYRANPFFLTLTERTPAYQLFFGSPGMLLLEGLFNQEEEALTDSAPLMKPRLEGSGALTTDRSRAWLLAMGLFLLGSSMTIIYLGGRRK
jgi:nitrous oxidase accessory protein